MKTTTTITAIRVAKVGGRAVTERRTYTIDRDPEDWGDGRTRIFYIDHRGLSLPLVVHTDSIRGPIVGTDA